MTDLAHQLLQSASAEYWRHTVDLAFIKDLRGVYVSSSQAFAEMTGHSAPEDVVGKTDYDVFADPELARRYTDDDERLLAGGAPIENYVEPIAAKNGRPRYGLTSKYILRDESGRPVGIFGVSRDITVEYEAKQTYENELRSLFELPPDAPAAVLFDVNAWRVVDARYRDEGDQVVSRFSHIDEYLQNAIDSIVDDDEARAYFAGLNQAYLQKAYQGGIRNRSVEYRRRFPSGEIRWVRDDLHLLLDPVNGNLSLIIILRDIHDAKRAYDELLQAAEWDGVTRLLNHNATVKRIEECLESATGLQALFIIDLDNFKQINDTFGHPYGDAILGRVAEAMRGVFRGTDVLGRLGGDEFMVLMRDTKTKAVVRRKADELVAALQFSARNEDTTIEVSCCAGVTVFQAGDKPFNALYGEADTALYQAKQGGKNQYRFFGQERGGKPESADASPIENVSTVQLRTLLDYMDGGVVLAEVTDDIRVTYVSPSLYRSFECEPGGNPTEDMFGSILPEDLPGLRDALFACARSNDLLDYLYRVQGARGVQWRHIRAKRIPESGDGVHRIVSVITDFTELKRADESLRKAEERYRIAVEQTGALLWEVDPATRTLRLTGPTWQDRGFAETVYPDAPESYLRSGLVAPEAEAEFRRLFADLYAGREGGSYYLQLLTPRSDRSHWVRARFRLLRDESGAPYLAAGIIQTVVNVEAEMRRFEEEERFAGIVHASLRGFLCADLTQNRIQRNTMQGDDRYAALADATFDEYHRQMLERLIWPEDAERFGALTRREALLARYQSGENWRLIDYRRVEADGTPRWTCLFLKLMRHPVSGDVYAFCYLRDNEVRRSWELALGTPLRRNATLLLYAKESMEALARYVLASGAPERLAAVSVLELLGLERLRAERGEEEASGLLFTFGRLCRIAIGGNVIMGQLEENRIAILRVDAEGTGAQRKRVLDTIALLREMLSQAHPGANVSLIGGFAMEAAGRTTYAQLLHKAELACRTAGKTLGESAVAYVDTGLEPDEGQATLEEKYQELELRYQQQAYMLRVSESDELTGMLSKAAFCRRVREILDADPGQRLAIVRFDINRFKVYNDIRGIGAGDRLLRDIGAEMRKSNASFGRCARLESDHFVVLVPDDEASILRSKERLADWLARYSPDFRLSFTVGVYRIADPEVDVSLMCDRALLALRSAKTGFETKLAYYDDGLRDRMLEEQRLVDDMRAALDKEQFVLFFQPQVDYESGKLVGAEALVRWNHPTRGVLPSAAFIPLFEQNGLITRLDEYVWEHTCRCIAAWRARYAWAKGLAISVNVSRLDIYDRQICEKLQRMVARYGLPASALRLEITESAYMEHPQQLIETVGQLQKAGFLVEMDDFGSGYSSLNTLKDVSVDVLKLDMKFLESCADSARGGSILNSVIRMAHWLKLPIISEGVETKTQADYLKSLGCVLMQGYYFDRPMPQPAFEKLLEGSATTQLNRYRGVSMDDAAAFWDPSAQMVLLFNSFVGGAAIMEYRSGGLEISRANEAFYRTLGLNAAETPQTDALLRFDPENRALLLREVEQAVRSGDECGCELALQAGAEPRWLRARMRLLAQNADSAILYVSVENITERKRAEREQGIELERDRLMMRSLGVAFFDYDCAADTLAYEVVLPRKGYVHRTLPHYYANLGAGDRIGPESATAIRAVLDGAAGSAATGAFDCEGDLWERGPRPCRVRYLAVTDQSGRVTRLVGQAYDLEALRAAAAPRPEKR